VVKFAAKHEQNFLMCCYFLKLGHIASVECLEQMSDEGSIAQCHKLFKSNAKPRGAEGFELWDRDRFIYRYPEEEKRSA
jgi:hypothetical protein